MRMNLAAGTGPVFSYAGLNLEVQAAASHAAGEVVVKALDDLDGVQGNPIGSKNAP